MALRPCDEGGGVLAGCLVVLAVVLVVGLVLQQFLALLDRPQVYVENPSGRCVRVVDPKAEAEHRKSEWSCHRLPDRYERVWVY